MHRNTLLSTDSVLAHAGPFTDEEYTADFGRGELANARILVVGAGGLGCEILKDLALSSFKQIECIDMDTIELTNLNRQFLFREDDVGKSKAEVASLAVMKVVKDVEIVPYCGKIQDFDTDFYRRFTLIVCGLDNIEARRWINQTVVDIAERFGQYIPLIDGGTEGFQGSVKLMIPTITACFECYMALVPKQTTYPLCTLASTPRLPEHCIEWAHQLEWPKLYPDTTFDADVPEHVSKMYEMSLARAKQFGIEGVTRSKTLGVVKNIIPAVASTNAVIAGACCNEAFKFITSCNPGLKDSMYYNGAIGEVLVSDEYSKLPDCAVCGNRPKDFTVDPTWTLKQFAETAKSQYGLEQPDFFYGEVDLYNCKDPAGGDTLVVDAVPFDDGAFQVHVVDRNGSLRLNLNLS